MKKNRCILLSFLIPLGLMILCYVAEHVYPFGEFNSFISDANSYYINYISYWNRVLNGQESLFYSFTKGIGGSTSSLVAYHLLNPYLLLFALFRKESFPLVYTIASLLSVSTCGLTMYLFLHDFFRERSYDLLIFSTSYAFCGYLAVNSWQLQWLPGVMLLPLVMMGLWRILQQKSPALYVVMLTLSLIMNFYIGYMITVAVVLVSLILIATQKEFRKKKVYFSLLFGTLLAGLMSSIVWLPALLSLRGGRASKADFSTFAFDENSKLVDILSRLFTGAHSTDELQQNGLPAIFSGVFPLFLCILFFADDKNQRAEKKSAAALLLVYLLSFYINTVSAIFQGFSYTVWFNYRYSFIFSFLIIFIAAKEFPNFIEIPSVQIKRIVAGLIVAAALIFAQSYSFSGRPYYLIDFAILAFICIGRKYFPNEPGIAAKRTLILICLLSVCINSYANTVICAYKTRDWWTKYNDTVTSLQLEQGYVDAVKEKDEGLYRLESEVIRNGSAVDPMMFDYNGASTAGSLERDFVMKNIQKYGIQRYDNRYYYYPGISASMDSLLGIKYLISSRNLSDEKEYKLLKSSMGIGIYQNPYALSMAILSDSDLSEDELFEEENLFKIQNELWKGMTGEDRDLYKEEKSVISYTSHNDSDSTTVSTADTADDIQAKSADNTLDDSQEENTNNDTVWDQLGMDSVFTDESESLEVSEDSCYILAEFTASFSGPYYLYEYAYVDKQYGSINHTLQYLGNYEAGDKVIAKIPLDTTITKSVLEVSAQHTYIGCLNMDLLKEYSNLLNSRDITIREKGSDDSQLSGDFTAEAGQKLFFTIPYDEGWTLKIDGIKTKITKTAGLFMVADAPEGSHHYQLTFFPQGLNIGLIAGCSALVAFIIWIVIWRKDRKSMKS